MMRRIQVFVILGIINPMHASHACLHRHFLVGIKQYSEAKLKNLQRAPLPLARRIDGICMSI